ncbi:MAG TPA: transporter [Thermoanaerobaculia bacterium]|nr:transporter [Thermoanaerobaculia bacterium]
MSEPGASAPPPVDRNDLGFGSVVARQSRERLLNRDGSFNVRREGLGFFPSLSAFHWLLRLTWPRFLLVLVGGYVVVQLGRVLLRLAFSAQTLAALGYDGAAPAEMAETSLRVFEAVAGLLLVALGSGITFARFAQPGAKLLFSPRAIVGPYGDAAAFMFRVANARRSEILDLSARVLLVRRRADGDREFLPLRLERSGVPFFPLSWTVVHPIDRESPLWNETAEDLAAAKAEFLVLMTGTDETFAQPVYARSSYVWSEVEWNARFVNLFNPPDDDGGISIDVGKLGEIEKL